MQTTTVLDRAYANLLETLRLQLAKNPEGVSLGLLIVRIDKLEDRPNGRGGASTDDVLARLESQLRKALRQHDVLIRLTDDTFAAVMGNLRNREHLSMAADKLLRITESTTRAAPRIGMALAASGATDADRLLHAAESALQKAEDDEESCRIHDTVLSATMSAGWITRADLEDALDHSRLEVHYQPKVSCSDYTIVGAEALLRWFRAPDAPVSPDIFVPLAERCGLIGKLTWQALTRATRQASEWMREFGSFGIAMNVTPNVVEHHDLATLVANAIGLWSIPPQLLTIEVTESALTQNPAQSTAVLKDLRSAGVRVAIDDFGTGYSSLAHFKTIPADELKIDKSFVVNMLHDAADRQLVHSIVGLAHGFGLRVTAEGVENAETAELLAEMGCDYLQGYHFSRPVPAASISALLAGQRCVSSDAALPAHR